MYVPVLQQTLSIENISSAIKAYPELAVGDIVRIAIIASGENGQGLIQLGNQKLSASLPSNVQQGDLLLAKVTQLTDAVVLKLLEVTPLKQTTSSAELTLLTKALNQLDKIPLNLFTQQSIPSDAPSLKTQIYQPLLQLLITANFITPESITTTLKNITNGQLPAQLKDLASQLSYTNLFQQIYSGLRDLQTQFPIIQTSALIEAINKFVDQLEHEANNIKNLSSNEKRVITELFNQLKQPFSTVEEGKNIIESSLKTVENQLKQLSKDPHGSSIESSQIAAKQLGQLATAQETLNQLNPLMHSFGDPAFLLFPFLFQGLFAQAQIIIDPKSAKHQKNQTKSRKYTKGYQQIHLNVPLPFLGQVGVDVAYREQEILVHLVVEDREAAVFLEGQLEILSASLRTQGFEKTELSTKCAKNQSKIPTWVEVLGIHASVLA